MKNGKHKEIFSTCYYKDDLLHREEGPAIEFNNGSKEWYLNGNKHNENGPAVIKTDVFYKGKLTKEWYQKGKRHREDGPAIEDADGSKKWHLYGIQYTEEEFNQWLIKKELNEKLENNLEAKPKEKKKKI